MILVYPYYYTINRRHLAHKSTYAYTCSRLVSSRTTKDPRLLARLTASGLVPRSTIETVRVALVFLLDGHERGSHWFHHKKRELATPNTPLTLVKTLLIDDTADEMMHEDYTWYTCITS